MIDIAHLAPGALARFGSVPGRQMLFVIGLEQKSEKILRLTMCHRAGVDSETRVRILSITRAEGRTVESSLHLVSSSGNLP